jgi:hypothetical protein
MELQAIVPSSPKLPVLPIIVAGQNEPGMFHSFEAYPWFLKVAFGAFGECAINHLTVRLGLRRRASAKADFASSILPSSAKAAASTAYGINGR